jgi:hypothetical protein
MLTFDQHLQGALPLDCVDVFYRPGGVAEKPAAIEQRIDPVKDRNAHDCRGQVLHLPLTLKETMQF